MPAPVYPSTALFRGIGGKAVLIDVDAKGMLVDAKVERAQPAGMFDHAAINAVKRWRFEPAIENGRPVASRSRVPVEYARRKPESVSTL